MNIALPLKYHSEFFVAACIHEVSVYLCSSTNGLHHVRKEVVSILSNLLIRNQIKDRILSTDDAVYEVGSNWVVCVS